MNLYKLPNGNWIDPLRVRAVKIVQFYPEIQSVHVYLGDDWYEEINLATNESASDMADKIASVVNTAHMNEAFERMSSR